MISDQTTKVYEMYWFLRYVARYLKSSPSHATLTWTPSLLSAGPPWVMLSCCRVLGEGSAQRGLLGLLVGEQKASTALCPFWVQRVSGADLDDGSCHLTRACQGWGKPPNHATGRSEQLCLEGARVT